MTDIDYTDRVRAAKQRLLNRLAEPMLAQHEVLQEVLTANSATEFGTEHDLAAVHSVDDLRRRVPIRTHEEYMPWIERAIAGEPKILTAEDPVVYFSSSGTTGREKHIPVTRTYMRDCFLPFYYACFARVVEHHPEAIAKQSGVLNLWQDPHSPIARTSGGQPHIGPSQVDFGKFGDQIAVGPGNAAPWSRLPDAFTDADHWERTYLKVRLAAEYDIRCVVTVNPAIAAALPYQLEQWWPRMVEEIAAGTLGGLPHKSPNPERAREIERLAAYFGTIRPEHLWPAIDLLVTWNTALSSFYLPQARAAYGADVSVLPGPVASCEGPVAVQLDRHPTAGPLYVTGCLYEFIPAEEEIKPGSATLLADELQAGREYHVVLTHVGGLYRCAVTDIVRVVDFVAGTPRVEYAGRSLPAADVKDTLLEPQLLRALSGALGDVGLQVRNATCRMAPGGRRYEVAIAPTGVFTADELETLGVALDARLRAQSPGYARGRAADRLDPVSVVATHPHAFLREWERRVRRGERPPRVKDRVFTTDPQVWERITGGQPVAMAGERR
ncbi:GH3 auxin-responsive promoter family protein [Hamadaea sp. NPDC051192]|uniref:GH3 family domain-containing protein n=1 Tax=Hamadaea sp. NPDC051192 TaxID=3154940 RepID=UPI00342F2D07